MEEYLGSGDESNNENTMKDMKKYTEGRSLISNLGVDKDKILK